VNISIFPRFAPGLVSAVFYSLTLLEIKARAKLNYNTQSVQGGNNRDFKKQAKMTRSVMLIMVNTALFSTLPFGYTFFNYVSGYSTSPLYDVTLAPFMYSVALLGAAGNLFLYAFKYPKFKACLPGKKNAVNVTTVAFVATTNSVSIRKITR